MNEAHLAHQIYNLVDSVLYVRKNEPTARIVFIHAYQTVDNIPSELAPNVKILDEAFPSITLDLVFVQGAFGPPVSQGTCLFIGWLTWTSRLSKQLARRWIFHVVECSCRVLESGMGGD
jgi:hypothetical protein